MIKRDEARHLGKTRAMAGIPYRSKMQPHWAQIKTMREGGSTWPEIVEKLEELGVSTQPHGVQQYYKRKTQIKRGGLGLPGWGNTAPVSTGQPQAEKQTTNQVDAPEEVRKDANEDWDFTPSPEKDPLAALEKALRGKPESTATNTNLPKEQ